jgi:hypothetical protein
MRDDVKPSEIPAEAGEDEGPIVAELIERCLLEAKRSAGCDKVRTNSFIYSAIRLLKVRMLAECPEGLEGYRKAIKTYREVNQELRKYTFWDDLFGEDD